MTKPTTAMGSSWGCYSIPVPSFQSFRTGNRIGFPSESVTEGPSCLLRIASFLASISPTTNSPSNTNELTSLTTSP